VKIVNLLATNREPVCICNLTRPLGLAQPTVSHHMKKLVEAGLLEREQRGKWAFFSLNHEAVSKLAGLIDLEGEELDDRFRGKAARGGAPPLRRGCSQRQREGRKSACCGDEKAASDAFGAASYSAGERGELPDAAALASLGCGNPIAVADLNEGETRARSGLGRRHRRDPLGQAGR
jgi:hypothetical protein